MKDERVQELLRSAPTIGESLCDDCREHFAAVREYLDAMGVAYELAPTLVRGLDYYTRTTFEFKDASIGAQDTICGGGRYDGLIEAIGGPPTPGIGFGAGIERLLLSAQPGRAARAAAGIDAFLVLDEGGSRADLLRLLGRAAPAGIAADTDYAGRSRKGQLTQAGRLGAGAHSSSSAADAATIRERGADDRRVDLDELAATLARR